MFIMLDNVYFFVMELCDCKYIYWTLDFSFNKKG